MRLIDDMIFHCNNYCEEEVFLIAVDFEKAFDSVSHNFLFKVLDLGLASLFVLGLKLYTMEL